MPKRQGGNKKGKQSNFAKLSIFQPNKYKFKKLPIYQRSSNYRLQKYQTSKKIYI